MTQPPNEPPAPAASRRRGLRPVHAVVPLTAAVLLTAGVILSRGAPPGRATPVLAEFTDIAVPEGVDLVVPEFELLDANGKPVDQTLLDGRYTVLDFFFTNCPFACPGMAAAMRRVQEATPAQVRLLSISVDGDRDTPEVIRAYAERSKADPQRWTCATGSPPSVRRIVSEHLMMSMDTDPDRRIVLPGGGEMANIDHPTRLLLVGPDRRVIAMASYTSEHAVDRLIQLVSRIALAGDGGGEP